MKKVGMKVVVFALCLALTAVAFAGCGSKGNETQEFVIGSCGPLTGGAASYGISVKNGAELAVAEINANGGINGMQIKYMFEDDELDAEKGKNVYYQMVDKGMKVFLGSVTSGVCVEVAAAAKTQNMFLLTPSGSSVACTLDSNAFKVCFSDPSQGASSAKYIKENTSYKKVGVLYNSSDVYSSGIYETFAKEATGLEVTTQDFLAGTTDYKTQLTVIKNAGCELLFLPIYYQEASEIITQAKQLGMTTAFFGCDGLDGLTGVAGPEVTEGVMLLTPFVADSQDAKTVAFVSAYKAKYGSTPDQFAADGYDGVYIIKAAMEKAGVKDANISVSELCEKLKTAMGQIEVEGVTGKMTWPVADNGTPNKSATAMKIDANGNYVAA